MTTNNRFEYIREVQRQQEKDAAKRQKLHERAREAKARLELLRRQYEEKVVEGVKRDEDNTKELDKLQEEIDKAEQIAARRVNEAQVAQKHFQTAIDKEVVKSEFRKWKKEYNAAEIVPALGEIQAAKKQLTIAYRNYQERIRHFEQEKGLALNYADPSGRFDVFGTVGIQTRHERERYMVTVETLNDLIRGNIPKGVELDDDKNEKGEDE